MANISVNPLKKRVITTFSIAKDIKIKFVRKCKSKNISGSRIIENFMKEYCKNE